jgi:hypothetical protein
VGVRDGTLVNTMKQQEEDLQRWFMGLEQKPITNKSGKLCSDDWRTPDWLYKQLDDEFHFDFDPCPYGADFDGLSIEWGGSNFVNPPYNRFDKPKFIKKAYEESLKGKTSVLLIPAYTGTADFHNYIFPHAEIRYLRGRVAFKGFNSKGIYSEKNKGRADSMIVIFRGSGV